MDAALSLFHDLTGEIECTETVDLHSHLVWHQPQTPSLAYMVFYHFIRNELCAAGMPLGDIDPEDETARLRAAIPWLDKIANTGTSYCLRRILRDLYDVPDGRLTEENLDGVIARVAETAKDADWPVEVIHRRARLRKVFVSHQLGHEGQAGFAEWRADAPEATRYASLFEAAGECSYQFDDDFQKYFDVERRRAWAARHPEHARHMGPLEPAASFQEWLDGPWHYLTEADLKRFKAFLTWTSVYIRHCPEGFDGLREKGDAIWKKALAGSWPTAEEAKTLRMAAFTAMIEKARTFGIPMQVFFGSRMQGRGGRMTWDASHADYDPDTIRQFGLIANDHRDVRFDFLEGAVNNSQEMAIMAKMRPNVGAAGLWWHAMYPAYIRRILSERLDVAPSTKTCLFFSDAYMVEWCYGKRKLVEREFARLLAERVAYGYFTRADASRIIRAWMVDNPMATYKA